MKQTKSDKIKVAVTCFFFYSLLHFTPLSELNFFFEITLAFVFSFVSLFGIEVILEKIEGGK